MATPFARRPESGGGSPMAVPAGPAAADYLLPATGRGMTAQAAAALGLLTGLWVAFPRCSSRCSTAVAMHTSPM